MFGIGFGEMVVIAVVLLLVVGPKELPTLLKTVGKGIRDVKRASSELRRSTGIDELMNDDDLRNPLRDRAKAPPTYKLTAADLEREQPLESVDVAHARVRAEEASRVAQTNPARETIGEPTEGA
jgi:sec-independent protein translocase protein TatB